MFINDLAEEFVQQIVKGLVKFLILLFMILCLGWFGLWYYFSHVNKIADKVRSDVAAQAQAHNTRLLSYNEIPNMYRNAVIATEERSFLTNKGLDLKGTLRAVFVDFSSGKPLQGGSTIT